MNEPRRIELNLLGQTLTIRSEATPEYLRRLAKFLEDRVAQLKRSGVNDPLTALSLAALDITDELFRSREEKKTDEDDVGARLGALVALLDKVAPPDLVRIVVRTSVAAGAGREALRAGDALAGVERGGADLVLAAQGGGEASTQRFKGRATIAADAVRWEGRDRGGERFGFVTRLPARHDAVGQPHAESFARAHAPAGQDQIEGAP
jgi:cell division protein ZapA (FtsZ GTPase activity inhibitor)